MTTSKKIALTKQDRLRLYIVRGVVGAGGPFEYCVKRLVSARTMPDSIRLANEYGRFRPTVSVCIGSAEYGMKPGVLMDQM